MTTTIPDNVRREVLALTTSADYAPIAHTLAAITAAGLRRHPGPVREGTTVWLYATGRYRPAVVLRRAIPRGGEPGLVRVVHSTPTSARETGRLFVKNVPAEELWIR